MGVRQDRIAALAIPRVEVNSTTPETFSFTYLLYLCEHSSSVGASCARDIALPL